MRGLCRDSIPWREQVAALETLVANSLIDEADHLRQFAMAEPSIEKAAEQLDREAHAIHQVMQVADSTPLAVAANLPAPEPMPRKSSIPMAAPVSREIPNQAGQWISPTDTRITLNPAEREIARSSYHWLPKDQAENLYARQKQKLAAMRKAGLIRNE